METVIERDTVSSLEIRSKVDVGTTAAKLSATPYRCQRGVTVRADPSNWANVSVGHASTVTSQAWAATDGLVLQPGEAFTFAVDSPDKLWVIGQDEELSVTFICE